jgi:glutamyl-tRNA synthetase
MTNIPQTPIIESQIPTIKSHITTMPTVRTRFAPSPTGYMHIGNLRTALYAYLIARTMNGKFILRIEDTDQERLVEGSVEVIYNTLKLVGLEHDEGPDIGGPFGPYVQSQRKSIYKEWAEKLIARDGGYYCFCSKEKLDSLRQEAGGNITAVKLQDPCRDIGPEEAKKRAASGEPLVVRQKIPRGGSTSFGDLVYGTVTVENSTLEDGILLKSDGLPTYNFANVVDDHLMQISHVIRGSEYLSSAPKYNLIYQALEWEIPAYIHLPLIMKAAGSSPSARATPPSRISIIRGISRRPSSITSPCWAGTPRMNGRCFHWMS